MRVVSWNVRRATESSEVWPALLELDPDIALLQEIGDFSSHFRENFNGLSKRAIGETGLPQRFSTGIATKGEFLGELILGSEFDWVNDEREHFSGNIIACSIKLPGFETALNTVSVYSPAWPVNEERIVHIDTAPVKLTLNLGVWCTEILWSLLKGSMPGQKDPWIIGGDFNSSETFDYMWKDGPRGNLEIIERMNALGLTECLRSFSGKLTPTFRNPRGGKIVHQLDHIYVSELLLCGLATCRTGKAEEIFDRSLSDHLPIIADSNPWRHEPILIS